jgi:hypothetical protein
VIFSIAAAARVLVRRCLREPASWGPGGGWMHAVASPAAVGLPSYSCIRTTGDAWQIRPVVVPASFREQTSYVMQGLGGLCVTVPSRPKRCTPVCGSAGPKVSARTCVQMPSERGTCAVLKRAPWMRTTLQSMCYQGRGGCGSQARRGGSDDPRSGGGLKQQYTRRVMIHE